MGVYIPNVEAPRNCNSCPLIMTIDNTCSLTMGGCTKDERPPHCPLIIIPSETDIKMLKNEAEALGCVVLTRSEFEAYENAYILQAVRKGDTNDSNT